MSIDLSSISSSISSFFNRNSTSNNTNKENESLDVNTQIRDYAKNLMSSRKSLADYMYSPSDSFENITSLSNSNKLLRAISKMKNTNNMSSIEKYKYMMEQAQEAKKIDTTEPDPEKLLSESQKIIRQTLTNGLKISDIDDLNEALAAKHIALSRLDLLG